ncbi:MAG: YggT family protein [Deltaproteobacteria bacterium]|nr:YggT family protein [Deltaproteobacteria bacterium]
MAVVRLAGGFPPLLDGCGAARLVNTSPAMSDNKLAADDARRALQHESVKSQVEGEVNAEIAAEASHVPPGGGTRIEEVAGTFRQHAVDEVVSSERAVQRTRGVARVSQFVDYAFFLLYALLAIRFLLALVAARSGAGFVKFIVAVSDPFYAPFRNIVSGSRESPSHTVLASLAVAFVVYVVLHLVINRLLRLIAERRTEI